MMTTIIITHKQSDDEYSQFTVPQPTAHLKLGQRAVRIEDSISLLEFLTLLLWGRENHGPVGSVDLEKDGVFVPRLILQARLVDQFVVLRVCKVVLGKAIGHHHYPSPHHRHHYHHHQNHQLTLTIMLSIAPGYDIVTFGFLGFFDLKVKLSGNVAGRMHQIPSVSNSSGRLQWSRRRVHKHDIIITFTSSSLSSYLYHWDHPILTQSVLRFPWPWWWC